MAFTEPAEAFARAGVAVPVAGGAQAWRPFIAE